MKVGDTVTLARHGAETPLPGYREVKPMVYTGLFPDRRRPVPGAARCAWTGCSSTTRPSSTSPSRATRWDSASVSAFSACCTWRSSRSASSASSISICSPRRRSVEYHAYLTNGEMNMVHSPQDMPDPAKLERIEEPYLQGDRARSAGLRGRGHGALARASGRPSRTCSTSRRRRSRCTTRCRSPS